MGELRQRRKNCHNCGAPLAPDALFCSKCGTKVEKAAVEPDETENETQKENLSPEEMMQLLSDKVRQAMESKVREEAGADESESAIKAKVEEKMDKFLKPKKEPLPGIKHKTKKIKDQLTKNPYDLELIFALGDAYMEEEKWPEAANVLIRGWKRVGEFPDPAARFEYLYQLLQASFHSAKFKQAHAVLMDMDLPDNPDWQLEYYRLACKVYAMKGDLQPSLKAFNQALELCTLFDQKASIYYDCMISLKKVGAKDAAKSTLESMADPDDLKKLGFIECMADIQVEPESTGTKIRQYLVLVAAIVVFGALMFVLYLMEHRSLKNMKMVKA